MARPVNNSHARRGMTLVELIVAITLTAIVVGSTTTILRSMTAARTRVDRQAKLEQQAQLALRAITTALRNAYRTDANDWELEGLKDATDGPPADRIRFFTTSRMRMRPGQPESDTRECEFFLARAEGEQLPVLLRRMDPTRNVAPDGGGILQRIAGNVVSLAFAYNDGTQWQQVWPADYRAWPVAIAVHVIVADEKDSTVTASARAIVGYTYQPVKSEVQLGEGMTTSTVTEEEDPNDPNSSGAGGR